jgi:ribonuclease P protein component
MANPSPNQFQKSARLRAAPEFQAVFKSGLKVSGAFFRVYFLSSENNTSRLGMAVPKKALPLSVMRNRVKRICREAFRQQSNLPCGDFVVVAQSRAKTANNLALKTELLRLLAEFSKACPIKQAQSA